MGLALVQPDGNALDYPKSPRYRPKRGHIIARKLDRPVYAGNIQLPGDMKESLLECRVVLVGSPRIDEHGHEIPMDVNVGDVVVISERAGLVLDLSDRLMLLVHEENVLGVKLDG